VVGETPNLAARLQALAMPNTLVIAEATRRQIGGLFDLADLGPQALAGFAEAQPAWRVIGESGVLSRFEALRSGTTPLIGREEELDLLRRRWEQAKTGEGRVVLLSGEPGIGKSRLTAALSQHIGTEPTPACAISVRRITRTALFVRSSSSSARRRVSRATTGSEAKLDKFATLLGPAAEIGDVSLWWTAVVARRRSLRATRTEPTSAGRSAPSAGVLRQLEGLARTQIGVDDLRGSALDRSDLARASRPNSRADRPSAGPAGRHLPS
jgi:hypothetical protein